MSLSTRIIRCAALALSVAVVAAPAAPAASDPASREAAFRAAHWQHEDVLYGPRPAPSGEAHSAALVVRSDEEVGRSGILLVAAGTVALVILGATTVVGARRKVRGAAQS